MKKVLFIIFILSFNTAFSIDDIPIIPTNGNYSVQYIENDPDLINVENMKKKESIEQAKKRVIKSTPGTFQFNRRQNIEQKALDYIYNQNNSLIPIL